MYRDIPMDERINRIGELLAKGVYLYLKKEKEGERLKNKRRKTSRLSDMTEKNK